MVYAPNREQVAKRRVANSDKARAVIGIARARRLWASEIEKLDIYRTKRANAPVNIFVHGGALARQPRRRLCVPRRTIRDGGGALRHSRLHQCRRCRRQPVR
jgi:hypothetical protein